MLELFFRTPAGTRRSLIQKGKINSPQPLTVQTLMFACRKYRKLGYWQNYDLVDGSLRPGSIPSDAPVSQSKPNPNTTAILDGIHNGNGIEAEGQPPNSKENNKFPVFGFVSTLCSILAAPTAPNSAVSFNMGLLADLGSHSVQLVSLSFQLSGFSSNHIIMSLTLCCLALNSMISGSTGVFSTHLAFVPSLKLLQSLSALMLKTWFLLSI